MKYLFVALVLAIAIFALAGCEVNRDKAFEILAGEGCTQTKLEGFTMFGCGHDDNQSQEFTCLRNGQAVRGVICGQTGLFAKGYTVRYK
jgi:hypothetical protein